MFSGPGQPAKPVVKKKQHFEELERCPEVVSPATPESCVVVGDLNGNALFALNVAVARNILSLSANPQEAKERYDEFVRIYQNLNIVVAANNRKLARDCIAAFKVILSGATFNAQDQIFVGDTVADRGGWYGPKQTPHSFGNDYLTLYLFYKLLLSGKGQHSKTASNHDATFFCAWQTYLNGSRDPRVNSSFHISAKYFMDLIDKGFVKRDEAIKLVDAHKRSTKLFDYIHDEESGSFELIVHAPCGLETVWATAKYYKFNPSDFGLQTWDLTEDCAKTLPVAVIKSVIDHVNQKFLDVLLNDPREFEKYTLEAKVDANGQYVVTGLDHPVSRAMFNRVSVRDEKEKKNLITPEHIENGSVKFYVIHGHDGLVNLASNMCNYNNVVGQEAIPPEGNPGKAVSRRNGIGSRLPVVLPPKPKATIAAPLKAKSKALPPTDFAPVRRGAPSTAVTVHAAMSVAQPQPAEFKIKRSELTVFNEQRERLYTLLEAQQKSDKSILEKAQQISHLMTSPEMENFLFCLQYNTLEDLILTLKIAEISPLSLVPFFARQLDVRLIDDQVMKAIDNAIDAIEKLTPPQAEVKSQENFAALIPQTLTLLRELKARALLTEIVDDYELQATEDRDGHHGRLANKVKLFKQDIMETVSIEQLVYERVLDSTGGFRDQSLNTLFLKKLAADPFLRTMLRIPETAVLSDEALKTSQGRKEAAKAVESVLGKSLGIRERAFTQSMRLGYPRV